MRGYGVEEAQGRKEIKEIESDAGLSAAKHWKDSVIGMVNLKVKSESSERSFSQVAWEST